MVSNTNNNEVEPEQLQSENIYEDKIIFPDFKFGPLTKYRQLSTFCYKRMNVLLEGEEHIRLKHRMWNFMEKHPDFQHDLETPSMDRQRQLANKRGHLISDKQFYGLGEVNEILKSPSSLQIPLLTHFFIVCSTSMRLSSHWLLHRPCSRMSSALPSSIRSRMACSPAQFSRWALSVWLSMPRKLQIMKL
uniref:Peroxisomal acyl-coenzyme A oxidase 3 n=1 Tax=Bactrocera dorsalis TaxID=27457 RepID=A0A034VQQ9_BACDO